MIIASVINSALERIGLRPAGLFSRIESIFVVRFDAKQYTSKLTIDASQLTTKPEDKKWLVLNAQEDRNALKFIKHPKKVLHIDSIYRNRM